MDLPHASEDEKSMNRMSRALKKSVNVYTEINLSTMKYRQINLKDAECFNVDSCGEYPSAFEYMCQNEIHPQDVENVRKKLAPDVLLAICADAEGVEEVSVRYRLKNTLPMVMMETRAIILRDEFPHYFV